MPVPIVEMVPGLLVVAAMPPVKVSTPVGVKVGAPPPAFAKTSPDRVLLPASVTVEEALRVSVCAGMTPPAVWVRVARLTTMPPVPRRPVAPSTSVPMLSTVPPV